MPGKQPTPRKQHPLPTSHTAFRMIRGSLREFPVCLHMHLFPVEGLKSHPEVVLLGVCTPKILEPGMAMPAGLGVCFLFYFFTPAKYIGRPSSSLAFHNTETKTIVQLFLCNETQTCLFFHEIGSPCMKM